MISANSCARAVPARALSAAATTPTRTRTRITPHLICVAAALLAGGCSRGWTQSVTVGPAFGRSSSIVVALEGSIVAHQELPAEEREVERHRPRSALGIAAGVSAGGFWGPDAGRNAFAGGHLDYLPFLYRSGAHVGFGGGAAAVAGESGGPYLVAPRLWFALPFTDLAGAPLTVGLMLRCQVLLDPPETDAGDDDEDLHGGCGPNLVVSRVILQLASPR